MKIRDSTPSAMAGSPHNLQRPRHSISHRPPDTIRAKPQGGMAGTSSVDPGNAATIRAVSRMMVTPQPMTVSGHSSSPNGNARYAIRPSGMTHTEVTGTAIMLAITP